MAWPIRQFDPPKKSRRNTFANVSNVLETCIFQNGYPCRRNAGGIELRNSDVLGCQFLDEAEQSTNQLSPVISAFACIGFWISGWDTINQSLGNIRCSAGYACQGGYRSYATWQAGFLDWYRLIRDLYIKQWHLTTVAQIIPVYAPASDHNSVPAYIQAVEHAVGTWRSGKVLV